MTDKEDALGELQSRYEAFRGPIAGLPDAAYDETWLGTWNLSQLLAHLCGWYGEMTGAIARVNRGEPPTPAGVDYSDDVTWNAKFAAGALPGRAALTAWDSAFATYHAAGASIPDTLFGIDPEKGRPRIGNRLLQGAGIGHFEEHQPELDEWIASRKT